MRVLWSIHFLFRACKITQKDTLALLPRDNQDRLSPYNVNIISSRQVMSLLSPLLTELSRKIREASTSPTLHNASRQDILTWFSSATLNGVTTFVVVFNRLVSDQIFRNKSWWPGNFNCVFLVQIRSKWVTNHEWTNIMYNFKFEIAYFCICFKEP